MITLWPDDRPSETEETITALPAWTYSHIHSIDPIWIGMWRRNEDDASEVCERRNNTEGEPLGEMPIVWRRESRCNRCPRGHDVLGTSSASRKAIGSSVSTT